MESNSCAGVFLILVGKNVFVMGNVQDGNVAMACRSSCTRDFRHGNHSKILWDVAMCCRGEGATIDHRIESHSNLTGPTPELLERHSHQHNPTKSRPQLALRHPLLHTRSAINPRLDLAPDLHPLHHTLATLSPPLSPTISTSHGKQHSPHTPNHNKASHTPSPSPPFPRQTHMD